MSRGKKHPLSGNLRNSRDTLPEIDAPKTIVEQLSITLAQNLEINKHATDFLLLQTMRINSFTKIKEVLVLKQQAGKWSAAKASNDDLFKTPCCLMFNEREGADLLTNISVYEKEIILRAGLVQGRVYQEYLAGDTITLCDYNDDELQARMSLTFDLIFETFKQQTDFDPIKLLQLKL